MIGMRRHIGVAEALLKLRPGSQFVVRDDDYNSIEWRSEDQTLPTEQEVYDKIAELKQEEPSRCMREIRDWYLQNTDWTQGHDIRLLRGPEWCEQWDRYRQELRDITITQSPYFEDDVVMHLSGVIWPVEPSVR